MGLVTEYEAGELRNRLVVEPSTLGKLYRAKRNEYYLKSVNHSLVEEMVKEGWEEYTTSLKTKTKLRKLKSHDKQFEDDIWCQLYELGYRCLNFDENFVLPFGGNTADKKQIDVVAVDDDTILLIECKSSKKPTKAPSFKTEFEGLPQRLNGFRKVLKQVFPGTRKVKYIFATRNLRIDSDSIDIQRLLETRSYFYNDNTYNYVNSLIKHYKGASHYQFLGLLFKGEVIDKEKIEVPALEGSMGNKTYYMFSIEPHLLLRMGFILHRTEANEAEMPTYQRLLVPSRLKGITSYIDDKDGFFPNSIIVNFNEGRNRLQFEASSRGSHSSSKFGMLKIPNAFAIAYVIDGQHRLYGYANSKRKESNTIPVVAFKGLESTAQLKIFMDINENQKAVSASLRLTLEEDLYWNSDRADSRIKALRSSIIRELSSAINGSLYKKIQIGEDKALLSSKPFADALTRCGLLPRVKGNQFEAESATLGLYNISNHDHGKEMIRCRKSVVSFLNHCYGYVEDKFPEIFEREKYFIISNRGTYAFVSLLGSLNSFEASQGNLVVKTTAQDRFDAIKKYIHAVLEGILSMPVPDAERLLSMRGSEVETKWLRSFQYIVHQKYSSYCPEELIDWMERQDDNLQDEGRKLGTSIERHIKKSVIRRLKVLYGENWDLEIGEIRNDCESRANDEIQRQYKEGLGRKEIPWTDMFFIKDYKTIIDKHWTKFPKDVNGAEFKTFEEEFAIDIGLGSFNSKADKLKWMSVFNSYRNLWAHEGTKEKRLNREEVATLQKVADYLGLPKIA